MFDDNKHKLQQTFLVLLKFISMSMFNCSTTLGGTAPLTKNKHVLHFISKLSTLFFFFLNKMMYVF